MKYCPRCHSKFECKAGTILSCQCSKVNLSEKEKEYITGNYTDCLCIDCLEEIKQKVKNNSQCEEFR
ncbi:MAG: cysteine-rich CWC family protein [Chitinophagales bacterium]